MKHDNRQMNSIFTLEQLRMIAVSTLSSILAFYTPTNGFFIALVIMFGFNIFCGMRADGVSISRCKNFSVSKFRKALVELFLYALIILIVFTVMVECGDKKPAITAIKALTYVFMYVYLQNGFKNLIIAYPESMALHIAYHLVRFEFMRAMPHRVQEIIERYEKGKNGISKKKKIS